MPHQVIEYSANIESEVDVVELLTAMHEAAAGLDALPTAGIRTRAAKRDRYPRIGVHRIPNDHL